VHAYNHQISQPLNAYIFTNMEAIELALEDLKLQEVPLIAETAKKWGVDRSTLSRRFNGKTVSRRAYRENKSLLNNHQTKTLINEINRLSALGTPPTVAMVRRFASNLAGIWPGNHWVERFEQSHKDEIASVYLKGFDIARKKSDSWIELQKYFDLVFKPL
jgi:hypothetical protein